MGCRVDEKPVRKLENKSNNSNFENWSNSNLYGAEGVPRHRSLFERKHNINRTEFTRNFDLFCFISLTRPHNPQRIEDFCSVASALEGNTTLKTLALNVTFLFISLGLEHFARTKPKWQYFGMNCGALCKGLSNNNTLTNLAVFGSDATGMIDILQLNATKKSLTSFSFSVCILFKFVNFDL